MKVFQAINGQIFRTEKEAISYYGVRFSGALKSNLLFKVIIDEDGIEVG
jgi:hypothetical protein